MVTTINPTNDTDRPSTRADTIRPFYVMDILARAKALQAQGRSILHLEVGEPDFSTAQPIVDAGISALKRGETHYTPACGLPELRQKIADYYQNKFGLDIDSDRIIVTPGASGALQCALAVLTNSGDSVLLSEPGYPCNRNIAHILGINVNSVCVDANTAYQLSASHIESHWTDDTRAAMVATPSNPTGTLLSGENILSLLQAVNAKGGHLIVDEIYQGLVYGVETETALSYSDDVFVINSFSKYYGMTGWRLGWMVAPKKFVDAADRVAQNLFLAPPTVSQFAALEAFSEASTQILEARVTEFKERRDFLLAALPPLGFNILVEPQGAFYIYASCAEITKDAFSWTRGLLEEQGVAITPGVDFGGHAVESHVRFAYTRPLPELEMAVDRIRNYINNIE